MATSKLTNTDLNFTNTNTTTGTIAFNNSNQFELDKDVSVNGQIASSAISVSANGQIIATSNYGSIGADTLSLNDADSSDSVTLAAAPVTTSHTLTLPATQGTASSVLTNDGTGLLSWGAGAQFNKVQKFSVSTTYIPTPGTKRALVYCTGGGGAGGGAQVTETNSMGSGGGSGATYVGLFAIDDSQTGTVTVGSGGAGVLAETGNNGEASSFLFPSIGSPSATITANGGRGGLVKTSDAADYFLEADSSSVGTSNTAFNEVLLGGYAVYGIAGGFGISHDTTTLISGAGASHPLYGGGGAPKTINNVFTQGTGNVATAGTGSGGGGATKTSDNSSVRMGGNGAKGNVIIFEQF